MRRNIALCVANHPHIIENEETAHFYWFIETVHLSDEDEKNSHVFFIIKTKKHTNFHVF